MTEDELAVALQKSAATYLNRYVPSTYQFREMLRRKCKKLDLNLPKEIVEEKIQREVNRRTNQGLLDDEAYAESWAGHLQRSGKSLQQIKSKLYRKRIPKAIIDQIIIAVSDDEKQRRAAILYAKQKN